MLRFQVRSAVASNAVYTSNYAKEQERPNPNMDVDVILHTQPVQGNSTLCAHEHAIYRGGIQNQLLQTPSLDTTVIATAQWWMMHVGRIYPDKVKICRHFNQYQDRSCLYQEPF